MAKRLTDKEKKKIIADYVECQNYSAVARKYKVSVNTVKNIISSSDEFARKCKQKKDENSKDMLDYMDTKKQDAMTFIDLALSEMMKKEKLERSSVQALATSIGIVVDKFTGTRDKIKLIKAQTAKVAGIQEEIEDTSETDELIYGTTKETDN